MLSELLQTVGIQPSMICFIIILALLYLFGRRSDELDNIPPFPERPYPILGHTPMMAKDPRRKLNQWAKQTGNIYSIYIGNQLTVVLSGFDVLKEALVKKAAIFSDRPDNFLKHKYGTSNLGVVAASGDNWKEQRTVSLNILRAFGMGKNILAEKIETEATSLLDSLRELKGEPSNIQLLINNCVSNIICNIILGKRYELDDPEFIKMMHILDQQFQLVAKYPLIQIYPWVRHVPGDLFKGKLIIKNYEFMEQYFTESFIEPLCDENSDHGNNKCMITEYFKEMRKRENSGKPTRMDKVNLLRLIAEMFSAGSETTSTTILWFVLLLLHNPEVLEKIQKEMDELVGRERTPSLKDRPQLNFLNASIMETQRFASIVPFSVQHRCSETTTLNGYTIPKDTTVMANLDSVLLDENIWPNPLQFRPERFLDDTGNLKTIEEFVPFSLGRRVCLGESIAKMELFLFLSGICHRFDIRLTEGGAIPPLESVFGITAPPKAYEVRLIER